MKQNEVKLDPNLYRRAARWLAAYTDRCGHGMSPGACYAINTASRNLGAAAREAHLAAFSRNFHPEHGDRCENYGWWLWNPFDPEGSTDRRILALLLMADIAGG